MDQNKIDLIDFGSAKPTLQRDTLIWWALIITETLLFTRLILEYFHLPQANVVAHFLYQSTDYLLYPFTSMLANVGGETIPGWVTTVAIIGYFLLAIILVRFVKSMTSTRSRIERARALSRRRYSPAPHSSISVFDSRTS